MIFRSTVTTERLEKCLIGVGLALSGRGREKSVFAQVGTLRSLSTIICYLGTLHRYDMLSQYCTPYCHTASYARLVPLTALNPTLPPCRIISVPHIALHHTLAPYHALHSTIRYPRRRFRAVRGTQIAYQSALYAMRRAVLA